MLAWSTTAPDTRAALAICGYIGFTSCSRLPCATPWETRILVGVGVATLGTATGVLLMMPPITPPIWPPGTPPGTPPTTPATLVDGGASSSLMMATFCGILVGVRSSPLMMSLWTLTTLIGAAAGGGGGGGGGGGATRKVISC